MRAWLLSVLVLCLGCTHGSPRSSRTSHAGLISAPLRFEANLGQTNRRVSFVARGADYALLATHSSLVLRLDPPPDSSGRRGDPAVAEVKLLGADPASRINGLDPLPVKVNYFIGNDPAKWRTSVPVFERIKYSEVYPGIDLVVSGHAGTLRLRFLARVGADVRAIRVRVEGTARRAPASGPGLALTDASGRAGFLIERPAVDLGDGRIVPVEDYEAALAQGAGSSAQSSATVNVVDSPQLPYSTLLCGSGTGTGQFSGGNDVALGVAVDSRGRVYVTGRTYSIDFPLSSNAFQSTDKGAARGLPVPFVAVLDQSQPPNAQLVYSTYLGGTGWDCQGKACGNGHGDMGLSIALGPNGLIYVTGEMYSADFPVTPGAFQATNRMFRKPLNPANLWGQSNAFLSVLDPNAPGSQQLVYSTYLGGTGGEIGEKLAVDSAGLAYVGGVTASTDFPVTPNAFQRANRGFYAVPLSNASSNGFLSILDPTKKGKASLKYSTYLGGDFAKKEGSGDSVQGLALDPNGLVYLTGVATSADFPVTARAFQSKLGTVPGRPDILVQHAYLTVLNPNKAPPSQLVYSSYLGGTNIDLGYAVAVDASGFVYVAGSTCMNGLEQNDDFPTTSNAFQPTYPHPENQGCRAFLSKLNLKASGKSQLVYSTYLGGGLGVIVAGFTSQPSDNGYALAVTPGGTAYLAGSTIDSNFPVTSAAVQPANGGGENAFLSVLDPAASGPASLLYSTYLGGRVIDIAFAVALGQQGSAYLGGYASAPPGGFSPPSGNWPVTTNAFEQARPAPSATPARYAVGSCGFVSILSPPLPALTPAPTATPRARPRF